MEEEPHFILAYHYAGPAKSSKDITAKDEFNHLQIDKEYTEVYGEHRKRRCITLL
jgi:hypothetical protein